MVGRLFFSLQLSAILTIVTLVLLQVAGAQVMSSPSYQLTSDSVNVGGGYSSSSNYVQESTVGEIATGPSDSTSFNLRAGYQQMQEVFLSLSAPVDVTMTPALGGLTGGTSNGSTTVTVITDSPSGYQMTIEAENDPAMQITGGGSSIADYDDGGTSDYIFTTAATDAHLGFSPDGVDTHSDFWHSGPVVGNNCNSSVGSVVQACWDGLSTTARVVAEGSGGNQPSGATTTLHFRVGIGGNASVPAGLYTATTTLTAYPL